MRRIALALVDGIPNARVVEIPDTDHVVNVRRPDAFNDVVLGFLAEVIG
jgi:pimeloyl-ACP methyl ester carboxylesterase